MGFFGGSGLRAGLILSVALTLAAACGGNANQGPDATGGALGSGGLPGTGGVNDVIIYQGGATSGGATSGGQGSGGNEVLAGAGGQGDVDLGLGAGDLTMLVVFDQSGSMAGGWDGRSKWQVANEAFMKAIVDVLDNLTIGAIFFPMGGSCSVASLDSGSQINFMGGRALYDHWQATAESRGPSGGTPLEQALQTADIAIHRASELGLLSDRFRVVLVTDGEPSCMDDLAQITALPAAWHELGVETWVMGLPGSSSAQELLDAIAAAGGTEKAMSLGTPTELDDGLFHAAR
ncbi:MAG: vWA domain-containing protein [Myxococcota bacterium]